MYKKKRYNGFSCQINDHCYSQFCDRGTCSGAQIGENCDPAQLVTCDRGLFCSNTLKTCVRQKKLNEPCYDYFPQPWWQIPEGSNFMVICEAGTFCTTTQQNISLSTCKPIYYRKDGESCSVNMDCYFGYRCFNSKCERWPQNDIPCSPRNCSSRNYEQCVCDGSNSVCRATANSNCDYIKAVGDWTDCWRKFNCHWERNVLNALLTEIFQPETCMGKNCGWIPRSNLCCRYRDFDYTSYSDSNSRPIGCGSTSALNVVLVVLILLVVSIIVVVATVLGIYLWQRRRQQSFEKLPD